MLLSILSYISEDRNYLLKLSVLNLVQNKRNQGIGKSSLFFQTLVTALLQDQYH